MELDDLKNQWDEYDKKLDTSIRLSAQVLRETRMSRASANLKWAFRGILFEQLMSIPAIVLLGIFISNHYTESRYLVPAIVLDLFAIVSVVSCAFQLENLSCIDYSQPVVAIQKKLQRVRILRLGTIKWGFLLWPILWIPFTIVTFKGVFGVNGYALFGGNWLAINLLVGAAITALMFWVSRRLSDQAQRSPLFQRLLNELAGRKLSEAIVFMDSLSRFEHEEDPA